MTKLSVNLNKVALLRNTRALGIPSVTHAATVALDAGAAGITVHPRPDARHIRVSDVAELRTLLASRAGIEFNIEGNPFHNLIDIVRQALPQQCTLVPDEEGQATSDHGWDLAKDGARLAPLIADLKARGVRVSLFMDPDPGQMAAVKKLGADRIELYTESYASAYGTAREKTVLQRFVDTANAARALGLGVNAGHDLNQPNLTPFLRAIPFVDEVSIGHALIADALDVGMAASVRGYLAAIERAQ